MPPVGEVRGVRPAKLLEVQDAIGQFAARTFGGLAGLQHTCSQEFRDVLQLVARQTLQEAAGRGAAACFRISRDSRNQSRSHTRIPVQQSADMVNIMSNAITARKGGGG